jgi:hypothetical protein
MIRRKMMLFWREGDRERKREKVREKEREKERERERISPSGENLSEKERFSPKTRESFLTMANFLFRWEKHLGSLGHIKRSQSPISLQSEFRTGLPKI